MWLRPRDPHRLLSCQICVLRHPTSASIHPNRRRRGTSVAGSTRSLSVSRRLEARRSPRAILGSGALQAHRMRWSRRRSARSNVTTIRYWRGAGSSAAILRFIKYSLRRHACSILSRKVLRGETGGRSTTRRMNRIRSRRGVADSHGRGATRRIPSTSRRLAEAIPSGRRRDLRTR